VPRTRKIRNEIYRRPWGGWRCDAGPYDKKKYRTDGIDALG